MIKGYYLTAGNKGYFFQTDAKKRTAAVVNSFIDVIAARRNLDPETIARIKADKPTTDRIKNDIAPATLEKKQLPTIIFYTITGANFTENMPEADFLNDIILF